jgi:hypothetical protein
MKMQNLYHPFDLEINDTDALDLFAEELPEQLQLLSDCLSSASSLCGCFSSVGSVISSGKAEN